MKIDAFEEHTCSYYCTGQRHAIECLAYLDCPTAEIHQVYGRYLDPRGWRVVEVRPANEADLAAWKARMTCGYDLTGKRYRRACPIEGETVGWLILIEPQEEASHGS